MDLPILTPGRVLARRYRAETFLGRGGMGEVWHCRDLDQRREVAIKVVPLEVTETPWLFHLFYSEVVAMARLDHPSIVPIYDFLVEPDLGFFFVMEFRSSARPLRDLMGHVLSWSSLRGLIEDLLTGVAYAHAKGILHLDLKPENILVRREGERFKPTILDFGISRIRRVGRGVEQWTEGRNVLGTLNYMAPEQLSGDLFKFGRWTDLYALGTMFYEMISARLPFPFRPASAPYLRLTSPAPALSAQPGCDVPEPFLRVVDWMLSREPHHRPRFAADLLMVLSTLPESAPAPIDRRPMSTPSMQTLQALQPKNPTPVRPILRTPSESMVAQDPVAQMRQAADDVALGVTTLQDPHTERVRFERTILGVAAASLSAEQAPRSPIQTPIVFRSLPTSEKALEAISTKSFSLEEQPLAGAYGLYGLRDLPLLGRLEERQACWDAIRDAFLAKIPRVVLLQGTAGVGKSRLARALLERGEQLGLLEGMQTWWSAQGSADEGLRGFVENTLDCRGEEPAEVRRRLEFWLLGIEGDHSFFIRDVLSFLRPPAGVELDAGLPLRISIELIERAATRRPVLVWLDDLQWSAAEGFALIKKLLAHEPPLPVCVVASLRSDEAQHPDYEALISHPRAQQIRMEALDRAAAESLLLGLLDLDEQLSAFLTERAEGNPLFVLQLLRQLVEADALERRAGKYRLARGFDLSLVPKSIDSLWEKRLSRAAPSQAEQRILWLLALTRPKLSPPLLSSLTSLVPEEAFHQAMKGALFSGLGLLVEGSFVWTHGLLRDYLLRDIPEEEKASLHLLAAKALEPMAASGEDAEYERSRHLLSAKEYLLASNTLQKSAVWSRSAGRFAQARSRNEELLRLLNEREPSKEIETLRAFAMADIALDEIQRGTQQAAELWLDVAQKAAVASQDPAALSHVAYRKGTLLSAKGDLLGALNSASHASQIAQSAGITRQEADSLVTQSMFLRRQSRLKEAKESSQSALSLYEKIQSPRGRAFALRELGYCALAEHRLEDATQRFEEALRLFKTAGDAHGEASIHLPRGFLLHDQKDFAGATDHYTQYVALMERSGLIHHAILGRLSLIGAACAAGLLEGAAAHIAHIERLGGPKEPAAKVGVLYHHAEIAASLGWENARTALEQAIAAQQKFSASDLSYAQSCERAAMRTQKEMRKTFLEEATRLWNLLQRPEDAARVRALL